MITGSITSRLILWLTLCSLVVIGSGLVIDYRLSRSEILERVTLQSEDTINRAVTDLENMLQGIEANTQIMGRILEQREYSEEGLEQMLKAIMETNAELFGATIALHPDFTHRAEGFAPYFFRRDGLLTSAELTRGDTPYWQRPWFTGAEQARRAIWSEPYFDAEGAEVLMTTYSVPVYRSLKDGSTALYAVVTADITLKELQQYLSRLQLGQSSFAVLLSQLGTVLSSGNPDHLMQHYRDLVSGPREQKRWQRMLKATAKGQVVDRELRCIDGDGRCMLRMGALRSTGWPVGVVYSESELLAPLYEFQVKSALVSILTLLVVALAVYVVSRRLTGPLVSLADATDEIARGNLNSPLPRHGAEDEVGRLISAFGAMKSDLKTYISDLEQATASRSRLEGELAAAREIQMAMLPQGGEARESLGAFSLWAKVRPAKSVGGDFYRYSATAAGVDLAIGDVSDKGVPAALFMARSMSLLPDTEKAAAAPDLGMAEMNNALEDGNSACMFVTAILAQLNSEPAELAFSSAGHPAPILIRKGRASVVPQDNGPALGLLSGQTYPQNRIGLEHGDRLAFYTDGVDEAFSPTGDMFGLPRLLKQLEDSAGASLVQAGAELFARVDAHSAEAGQSDDITLILVDYLPNTTGAEVKLLAGQGLASRGLAWLESKPCGDTGTELTLIAEEILTNIEKYAGLTAADEVTLTLTAKGHEWSLEVTDPGSAFNPLVDARGAELGRDSESTEIGGLGVHLIRQLSDEQQYNYSGGRNRLRIVKTRE